MHAESSRRWLRILTVFISIFALAGCGEGDGPARIFGVAATPLPPGVEEPAPALGVFSETHTDPVVTIQDIQQAGNEVLISTEFVRVLEGDRSLGLSFTTGTAGFGGATILFEDADISPYNTLKFSIDTSTFANFANLTVQLEPPPGDSGPGNFVFLAAYTPVATEGVWETYEIPLAAFPSVDLTLVNKLGFFNARDDSDTLLAGTLYLDDIHFTVTDSGDADAAGTPIDPEVVLYATEGEPDLIIPDDYDDVTGLGSGSVPNLNYADDDTYSKVLSVFSGIIDDTIVAQVGFIGFDPGFVTFYEDLVFKIKGMPNSVIFVKLFDGVDTLRINLTSSAFSEALTNGWYQVSIPISRFNGVSLATGLVFESDNSALMQFRMLLTDIGFSGGGTGGPGPGGGTGLGVFSETNTASVVNVTDIVSAGNTVTISETSARAFDGTVSLELMFSDNTAGQGFGGAIFEFDDADLSAYETLKFSIDTSIFANFANLTVQLEPPPGGTGPGNFVFLSDYVPVATSGNWDTYEIPLNGFTTVDPALVNKLGFFNARDGADVLLAGTLYLDDIHFTTAGGGTGGTGLGVFSETNTASVVNVTDIVSAGNTVTISETSARAFDGTVSLELMFSDNTAGQGFGGAIFEFDDADLSAYETLKFSIDTSIFANFANLTVQLEPPPGGTGPGNFVFLSDYVPVATSGNWDTYEIPLNGFTTVDPALVNKLGFFNARDGADVLLAGTLYLDDIHFTTASGGGGPGGGGNLTINGDFEAGNTSGWTVFTDPPNNGTFNATMAEANGGLWSGHLVASVPAGGGPTSFPVVKQANIGIGTVQPDSVVTVSFDLKGSIVGAGGVIFVEFFSELSGGGTSQAGIISQPVPTDSWVNYSIPVTTGNDVSGGVTLQLKADCGANPGCMVDAYFDNVSVVAD